MAIVFTPEQVKNLEEFQRSGAMHPFTCANRGDGKHYDNGQDHGILVPTVRGWICPCCDYTQDWAHDFMLDGSAVKNNPFAVSETAPQYDAIADAVNEVAEAAQDAFRKAGIEPGEWDSDDIVRDVKRGIANDIKRLAARVSAIGAPQGGWSRTSSHHAGGNALAVEPTRRDLRHQLPEISMTEPVSPAPEQRMTPKQLIETVRGVLSAVRHGPGPVAVVVNNNQPGTQYIVETAPNVTLDVGTALYVAPLSERGASGASNDDLMRAADAATNAASFYMPGEHRDELFALASRLRAAAQTQVMVDRLAFEGFLSMLSVQLGKPTNRDKKPAEIIAMARAMIAAAQGGSDG